MKPRRPTPPFTFRTNWPPIHLNTHAFQQAMRAELFSAERARAKGMAISPARAGIHHKDWIQPPPADTRRRAGARGSEVSLKALKFTEPGAHARDTSSTAIRASSPPAPALPPPAIAPPSPDEPSVSAGLSTLSRVHAANPTARQITSHKGDYNRIDSPIGCCSIATPAEEVRREFMPTDPRNPKTQDPDAKQAKGESGAR